MVSAAAVGVVRERNAYVNMCVRRHGHRSRCGHGHMKALMLRPLLQLRTLLLLLLLLLVVLVLLH